MNSNISVRQITDSIVPISRFNRGEASKIFDEVRETGVKVVFKNNVPACVLVEPERYEALMEALEDYVLLEEAERRMADPANEKTYTFEEIMEEFGITSEDLDDAEEVEIE